jgi:hypothetical protein
MEPPPKQITAIDITLPDTGIESEGVAYYRISPDLRDFISLCETKHKVVGFEYTLGELNFGLILGKDNHEEGNEDNAKG